MAKSNRVNPGGTARYVDGFVLAVPKNKLAAYRRMARQGKESSGWSLGRSTTRNVSGMIWM